MTPRQGSCPTTSVWIAHWVLALAALGLAPSPAEGATIVVSNTAELREAARRSVPGTRIELAPGFYAGGLHLKGLAGSATHPVVITAKDAKQRPVIRGGTTGLQISAPAHLVLEHLIFAGARANGLNIDDAGSSSTPAHHITLRHIEVRDVGPRGNCDGIKLSGVLDARIDACTILRWGQAGSAVDMVGCQRIVIEGCTFRHTAGLVRGSGVQAKGGSADITIRGCCFENAGARGVNAGGSTGFRFFRPSIEGQAGPLSEARKIRVLESTFVGGNTAVAFVGVDGAEVRRNTIYHPQRWAFRILQETRDKRFVSSRRGVIAANLIVFVSSRWSGGGVNVGAGTAPDTFRFQDNAWFCTDAPARTQSLLKLPTKEVRGTHGVDPQLRDVRAGDLRIGSNSRLRDVGAPARPCLLRSR